ncbi:PREDICTED: probable disease resistance protein At1g61190 [Nelumbo nucifera]|nr:PREDICTED: probable disease resistance protein At1g61190 [Nelumbo nucifera]
MIPSLKCLKIRDCKKLEEIITKGKENEAEFCTTHHDPPQLQLVGLKELIIDSCPKIKCLGLSSQGAPKLETLVMKDCPLLEEIVEKEEGILKDVILFPNVTSLTVRYCPRLLRTPFGFATPSLFQAHPLCLIAPSNLKTVILGGFHGYRKIFSATIARALLQLEWLQVYDCSSVEEIFEDAVDKIAIIFPKLQWLEFEFLPSLIKIYGRNSSSDLFRCPLLKDVTIRECPKLLHFPFQRQSVPLLQEFRIVSYGLTMEELSNKYGKEMLESGKPLLRLISKDVENRFFLDLDE